MCIFDLAFCFIKTFFPQVCGLHQPAHIDANIQSCMQENQTL